MTFANLLKITHANQGVHDPDANLHCKLDPRSISRNTRASLSLFVGTYIVVANYNEICEKWSPSS